MYFNKYLIDAITTNKININVSDQEFQMIDSNINLLKKEYNNSINIIYNNHRDLETIKKHCDLVKNIIYEVLELFPIMKQYRAVAFLTGSFARCSCKRNSDLDFHIIYLKEYSDKLFKYEEIIYYMLSIILNIDRNKIHPMLITKMHPEISNYLEKTLNNKNLRISIKSENKSYDYIINNRFKRRIYLQYCYSNNIETMKAYLKNEIGHANSEWAHVFYAITEKNFFDDFYLELLNYEKNILVYKKVINKAIYIKGKIELVSNLLKNNKYSESKDFKNVFQKQEFEIINEYISLKREIVLINNGKWKYINYYDNTEFLKSDIVFWESLEYMFMLFDVVEQLGNKYSLHSNKKININNINNLVNKIKYLNNLIIKRMEYINGENNNDNANCTV